MKPSLLFGVTLGLTALFSLSEIANAMNSSTPSPGEMSRRDPSRPKPKRPVQVLLLSNAKVGENLKIKCEAKVPYSVVFKWEVNGVKSVKGDERTKVEFSSHESILTIRKATIDDSGFYKCIARYNGTEKSSRRFIKVKPRITVKLKPKSAVIDGGSTISLHCINLEVNATTGNYSWHQKRLPDGQWKQLGNNSEVFVWKSPPRPDSQSPYTIYDFYCEIKTDEEPVRSQLGRITVTKPGTLSTLGTCPAEMREGIQWQQTLLGMTDIQQCSNGTGIAKRICEAFPGRPPRWLKPNLRKCISPSFKSLKDKFDAMDEGFNVSINISETLKELQRLTRIDPRPKSSSERSRRLFGGDLQTAVTTLGRIRALFRKEKNSRQLAKESFTPFTETASNLLDKENLQTWEEVTEDSPDTPRELIVDLEEFGLDLVEDLSGNEAHVKEAREKNLAFQVRRVGTKSELRESGLTFQQNNSLIRLPKSIFNENSPEAVSVVNVVYDTLSSILVGLNTTVENLSTNATLHHSSKIISSTVKPLGKEIFEQPVKIVLETNGTVYNATFSKRCVFWKPEENSEWSDKGCHVVPEETNEHVTTCECNHLTLFAVIVDYNGESTSSLVSSSLEIISTVGSAISLAAVVLTIFVYVYLWKTLMSARFVNLMNLCIAIALLDTFSVIRGPYKHDEEVCQAMGILLHYFVLALFMWMLCEGILLCRLLAQVFKSNFGRKWYLFVHLLGWGFPALIVAISLGVAGPSEYGQAGNCWLNKSNGFIWAALGPMIAVLLANSVVYGLMLYRLVTSYKLQQQDLVAKFRASVRASVVILPILGFTWIFAIFDYFFDEVACKYFFAILNSLQGFCIFLFHCVINEQVQQALFKSKRPERKSILNKIRSREKCMQESQDSLNTLNTIN